MASLLLARLLVSVAWRVQPLHGLRMDRETAHDVKRVPTQQEAIAKTSASITRIVEALVTEFSILEQGDTAERKSAAPASERSSVPLASKRRSVAPASERRSVALASERRSVAPASERRSVAPVSERRSVAPASDRRRMANSSRRTSMLQALGSKQIRQLFSRARRKRSGLKQVSHNVVVRMLTTPLSKTSGANVPSSISEHFFTNNTKLVHSVVFAVGRHVQDWTNTREQIGAPSSAKSFWSWVKSSLKGGLAPIKLGGKSGAAFYISNDSHWLVKRIYDEYGEFSKSMQLMVSPSAPFEQFFLGTSIVVPGIMSFALVADFETKDGGARYLHCAMQNKGMVLSKCAHLLMFFTLQASGTVSTRCTVGPTTLARGLITFDVKPLYSDQAYFAEIGGKLTGGSLSGDLGEALAHMVLKNIEPDEIKGFNKTSEALVSDLHWLKEEELMDFSLLVTVAKRRYGTQLHKRGGCFGGSEVGSYVVFFGIIDYYKAMGAVSLVDGTTAARGRSFGKSGGSYTDMFDKRKSIFIMWPGFFERFQLMTDIFKKPQKALSNPKAYFQDRFVPNTERYFCHCESGFGIQVVSSSCDKCKWNVTTWTSAVQEVRRICQVVFATNKEVMAKMLLMS